MRIADREFSPKLWAVLLYVVVLSCMLWLANWQLDRAALKVTLQQTADRAWTASAVPLAAIADIDAAAEAFSRVALQGRYVEQRQFLWDNRIHSGQAGFEVITPIRLDSGQLALVDRGWVAMGLSREQLPDVTLPDSIAEQRVSIEGFLSRPSRGLASGDALPLDGSWPRLVQYMDYAAMAEALGEPVVPALVQIQVLTDNGNVAPTPRPEWLTANWQPAAAGPATNYSYAFQWFAMAGALTILFVIVNSRKASPADGNQ